MARLNTAAELWSHLSTFYILQDSTAGVSTTVDSTAAAIPTTGSTIGTTATSTSAIGSYIRIGPSGGAKLGFIEAATAAGLTLRSQIGETAADNEAIVELTQTDLGDISDDGVAMDLQADRNRIDVATKRHRYAWHIPHTDYVGSVGLENLSFENLLVSLGINEGNLHGAGTTADPTVADWLPDNIDTVDPVHFAAEGSLKDGTNVRLEFWDCDFDPAKTINLARGQDAPVQFAFSARMWRWLKPMA